MKPRATLLRSPDPDPESSARSDSAAASSTSSALAPLLARREILVKALAQSRALMGGRTPEAARSRASRARPALTVPEATPGTFSVRVVEVGGARPVPKATVELWAGNKLLASEHSDFSGHVVFDYRKNAAEEAAPAPERKADPEAEAHAHAGARMASERKMGLEVRVTDLGGNVIATRQVSLATERGGALLVETERPNMRDDSWERLHDKLDTLHRSVEATLLEGLTVHVTNLERMLAQLDRTIEQRASQGTRS
jgi:hypothetical protein